MPSSRFLIYLVAALLPPGWLQFAGFTGDSGTGDRPVVADGGEFAVRPPGTAALVERLRGTYLLNGVEIQKQLELGPDAAETGPADASSSTCDGGFQTVNPYEPPYREAYQSLATLKYPLPDNAQSYELDESNRTIQFHGQEPVLRWYSSLQTNTEVCGVLFIDSERVDYRLRTFPDRLSALAEGYVVTHRHHCGTCSSLRDLAVYLERPDLTMPARSCARRLTARGVKMCLMEEIGFEEPCAETWAYNVLHTRRQCAATCVGHYGLWNVLTNDMGDVLTDEDGNLNPCLACDEYRSGPGFQYAAGRTRRSSGLESAIDRAETEIYPIDHRRYFE